MRWELSCGGIGLEDWAANVTLRATNPRQVRLAGGRRDSGRVRLRAEGVAGKACARRAAKGAAVGSQRRGSQVVSECWTV